MIIDKTYFIGEINIAQIQSPAIQSGIAAFIAKYEPEYLKKVLGYSFWKLFNDGIADDSGRWADLRDGAEYENCEGKTTEWAGFANDAKQSPIANYTYYWWQRNNVSFSTNVGEMEGKSDNAATVSPGPKMSRAWNEMVRQTRLLHDYLLNRKDEDGTLVYPEFADSDYTCFEIMGLF